MHQIVETTIPGQFVGQSLLELDIRNRYGVEVILIRKKSDESEDPSERPGTLPTAKYRFEEGDDVLLIGEKENIDRFRHNNPLV
ncbi:MAG: TrkA C-terminal domain-containing protein [Bacteroidota bacterium]